MSINKEKIHNYIKSLSDKLDGKEIKFLLENCINCTVIDDKSYDLGNCVDFGKGSLIVGYATFSESKQSALTIRSNDSYIPIGEKDPSECPVSTGEEYPADLSLVFSSIKSIDVVCRQLKKARVKLKHLTGESDDNKLNEPITKEWLDSFKWYTPDENEGYSYFPKYAISETLHFKYFDVNYCICAWDCEHDITIPVESINNKGHLLDLCKAFKFELKAKGDHES